MRRRSAAWCKAPLTYTNWGTLARAPVNKKQCYLWVEAETKVWWLEHSLARSVLEHRELDPEVERYKPRDFPIVAPSVLEVEDEPGRSTADDASPSKQAEAEREWQ